MKRRNRIGFGEAMAALAAHLALGMVLASMSSASGAFRVNTYTAYDQTEPAVAMDAQGNSVIVWQSARQDGSYSGVYGQRLDARGRRMGAEFRVNTTTPGVQKTPAVAMAADGRFTVVWASDDGSMEGIWARQYDSNGIPVTGEFLINGITDERQLRPQIAMNDYGGFVVSWERLVNPGVLWYATARQFKPDGTPKGPEFTLTQLPSGQAPWVAINNAGDFVAVWRRDGDSNHLPLGRSMRTRRYGPDGAPKEDEQEITSHDLIGASYPTVAIDGAGNYVVSWWDYGLNEVHARRFDANGGVQAKFPIRSGGLADNGVTMREDGLSVLVWIQLINAELWTVAQQYNRFGNPLNDLHQVAIQQKVGENLANQTVVAMERGEDCRFIVAWQAPDANGSGIYAAIFPEPLNLTLRLEDRAEDVALIFDTQPGTDHQFELSTNLPIWSAWGASIGGNGMAKTQLVAKASYPGAFFRLRASRAPGELAPADSEFTALALGKTLIGCTFLDAARFSRLAETGDWDYTKTGSQRGWLVFTYDTDGNDPAIYREEVALTFQTPASGTYRYSEFNLGSENPASVSGGSFDLN